MKRNILSIAVILLTLLNFVACWYSDILLDYFFVFYSFAHGFLLLIMLVCVIACLIMIIRKRQKLQNSIAIVLICVSVFLMFVFPFRTARTNFEFKIYADERAEIVEMVKNNKLIVDEIGNAQLPDGYKKVSSSGEVFVYRNDDKQVIAFWIFRGMLSGSVQLVYSSEDEQLIYDCAPAHPIVRTDKMSEHWYYVETEY